MFSQVKKTIESYVKLFGVIKNKTNNYVENNYINKLTHLTITRIHLTVAQQSNLKTIFLKRHYKLANYGLF